ncbi:angiopoietin-related protein 1-like [Anopheles marshallii]|uniref:angiopoietin-related protein 1-like n=1 Tax=Anopheles marshallii TaxID=1521116 RepID=UPI00237C167A|nr:angiopoietin-related protein 1-like [Anopheles marshallii]
MKFRITLFLLMFAKLDLTNGETQPTGGCGFGYELMIAKLESIEERLLAMEAKLQNVCTEETAKEMKVALPTHESDESDASGDEIMVSTIDPPTTVAFFDQTTVRTVHRFKAESTPKYPVGIEPTAEQLAVGEDSIYSSCREVPSRVSKKFLIRISADAQPINLLCDMNSVDAGWIVVQNRFNGSESFYRSWKDYEAGFGNLDGEFWLGLERISTMVNNGRQWEIMFWLKNFQGLVQYSKFTKFSLGNATELYILKQTGPYAGNAGDSITRHVGNKFTTYDRDNDPAPYNCAKKHRGGWWYHNTCISSNLNGVYGYTASDQSNRWDTMKPQGYGLQASRIMIREVW